MADYAGQAASIYDPQAAAETSQLQQNKNTETQALTTQKAEIDPQFQKDSGVLQKNYNSLLDRNDFQYANKLGGQFSGLLLNEQQMAAQNYNTNVTNLMEQRNRQLAAIAGKQDVLNTNYGLGANAVLQKYGGLKSQYQIENTQYDTRTADDRSYQDTVRKQTQDFQNNQLYQQLHSAELIAQRNEGLQRELSASSNAASIQAAAAGRSGGGGGSSSNSPSTGAQAGQFYSDLSGIQASLDKFRAAGYKGATPGGWQNTVNELKSKYSSVLPASGIEGEVKKLYHQYGLDHIK